MTLTCAHGFVQEDSRSLDLGTPQVPKLDGSGENYATSDFKRLDALVCDGGMDYTSQYGFKFNS